MRRRDFIIGIAGSAAAWPLAARAQQPMPLIGFLSSRAAGTDPQLLAAFRQGLGETGFVEDRNVQIDFRWAAGRDERLPEFAADLVRRKANVIVAGSGGASALAAKAATSTIPIVFVSGVDPIGIGLVNSLNRPSGNLTGVSNLNAELVPKRLELLHEAVPSAKRIGLLVNPANPISGPVAEKARSVARTLGLETEVVLARQKGDLDVAIASLSGAKIDALVVLSDPAVISWSTELGALTLRHAVPTIFQYREFVAAGGLMAYAGSDTDTHRLMGVYTGRILKGEKPADLPVQQATKVELIINLKTAKALGITFPLSLLGRADEVIE